MGARQSVVGAGQQQHHAHHAHHAHQQQQAVLSSSSRRSHRTLSLPNGDSVPGPSSSSSSAVATAADSDSSEENVVAAALPPMMRLHFGRFRPPHQQPSSSSAHRRSLPAFPLFDIKCPVCNKIVPSDEAEVHLVMCLTRPRITYNDDVLMESKGECVICFDEMLQGDNIARLPCLCIYHKGCIDSWFKQKNCCPEHPGDD